MAKNKKLKNNQPDPFISQNVWLKRLGFIILLVGMGLAKLTPTLQLITIIVIILAILTYVIKQIKGFFSSLWNS
jgi:hypothetical protein